MTDNAPQIDMSRRRSPFSLASRLRRLAWELVWAVAFRPSPRWARAWRRMLLRLFGARIGRGVLVYPSAKIWAPWNLVMEDFSCLGPHVDCYCVDTIAIRHSATVSQYSYLCTGTHSIEDTSMALITAPIEIGAKAWVAADVFIGPGVCVGEGAVVGARASVFKNVPAWEVVGGNPARFIKKRVLASDASPEPGR